MVDDKMADVICPLCGKPNPPDLDECQFCQAPLKTTGFLAPASGADELDKQIPSTPKPAEGETKAPEPASTPNLEDAIPDWLKETEANFLDHPEAQPSMGEPAEGTPDNLSEQIDSLLSATPSSPPAKENTIDDDWLNSLLEEAGVNEPPQPAVAETHVVDEKLPEEQQEEGGTPGEELHEEEQPEAPLPAEKPDWLTSLEASSTFKIEGVMPPAETAPKVPAADETAGKAEQEQPTPPEWLKKAIPEGLSTAPAEPDATLSPAELPGWLEALRPTESLETTGPTGPVEDVSNADIVTAGPLTGLRGVISPQSSAIRARKPPVYSIKLRVTDEQRARVEMMEAMLADEDKPTPLPAKPIISSRNIFRLVVVLALLLPLVWMIITGSQNVSPPQSGSIPGLVDFTQQIQSLPPGVPVLVAFDYEAGFSGEINLAISNVITQLMMKNTYLTLASTSPSGPPLGESMIKSAYSGIAGDASSYAYYANLGYIPGGTAGLLGLATSPRTVVPYALNGDNVWAGEPLNTVATIQDFSAVIVLTNDADTARVWIEQVGPLLREANRPLLLVSSSQAQPLILPYYEATPSQVQGLISGLAGGVAYARSLGNIQQNGTWDAFSIGITVSILIILIGSIVSGVVKTIPTNKKKEN
jgi:hypothetical protein